MFTKTLILTSMILFLLACQLQAAVTSSQWAGYEWGLWNDANNWKPWGVPNNENFAVIIDSNAIGLKEVSVGLQSDLTINRLDCYGNLRLVVGRQYGIILTLTDENGLTNHAEFMFDGNVEMNGNLCNKTGSKMQIQDQLRVSNGEVQNDGFILITPGGNLDVQSVLHNSGIVEMYQAVCSTRNSVLNNDDKGIIKGTGVIHSGASIQNRGAICAAGCGLLLSAQETITNTNGGLLCNMPNSSLTVKPMATTPADVNNLGTIEVNAGGGITFDCNLVNEPNAVITLLNGTLAAKTITQKAGAILKGFGGITGDIIIEPNALVELIGPTNIVGDMTIGEGATLDISNGTVLVTGDVTCNNGTIRTTNGTITTLGETKGQR